MYINHVFNKESLHYGSETGNWYGICKKCGKELIVHTGAGYIKPRLTVPQITRIYSNNPNAVIESGDEILDFNFDLFLKGKANLILEYSNCSKKL